MTLLREWLTELLRDVLTVPVAANYPSAWGGGLPVDPENFSGQLANLRTSLDHASLHHAGSLAEQPETAVSS